MMMPRQSAKKKRILLLADAAGSGPYYHLGDEALAEVAIERLSAIAGREKIVMICAHPETAGPAYGVKAIKLPHHSRHGWWFDLLRHPIHYPRQLLPLLSQISRSKLIFVSGGGNLSGIWKTTLESRLFIFRLANLLGKTIILAGQTFGPFSPGQQRRIKNVLRHARWIGVRDRQFSIGQLGLPVHFVPDDAVFLRPDLNGIPPKLTNVRKPLISISLRPYRLFEPEDYQRLFRSIRQIVLSRNAEAIFLPHYAPHGKDDLQIAETLKQKWAGTPELEIIDSVPPARVALAMTAYFELVITTRYHAAIFALTMGVPIIAIYGDPYTEAKFRGAFEQFGLNPLMTDVREAPDILPELAEKACAARNKFQESARRMQEKGLEESLAPYRLVAELLNEEKQGRD